MFFMKKVSKYLKSKTADLTRSAQKITRRLGTLCSPHGQQVPNAWSVDAQRLVPECPFDGSKTDHLMVYDRTAYVILFLKKYLNS